MKRAIITFTIALIINAFIILSSTAKTIELYPIKDSYLCDCNPTTTNPNGDKNVLYQGKYEKCYDRSFLKFDLSKIPNNSKIIKAQFQIYCKSIMGKKTGQLVYYPVKGDWNESTINFNNMPKINDCSCVEVLSDWPELNKYHVVNITKIVKNWLSDKNFGLFCHSKNVEGTGIAVFVSSDSGNNKPKLIIEYE